MILEYDFENEEEVFRGLPYKYEPDEKKVKEALVEILCDLCSEKMGKLYSEDGAYQMANFIVYAEAVTEELAKYYEEWLHDYFFDKAYEEYRENKGE